MIRRMIVVVTALLGVGGTILVSASLASAQVRLPFVFDYAAFFRTLFNTFPPFIQSIVGPMFAAMLQIMTGSCGAFCAS
jgi:hypothetical protein